MGRGSGTDGLTFPVAGLPSSQFAPPPTPASTFGFLSCLMCEYQLLCLAFYCLHLVFILASYRLERIFGCTDTSLLAASASLCDHLVADNRYLPAVGSLPQPHVHISPARSNSKENTAHWPIAHSALVGKATFLNTAAFRCRDKSQSSRTYSPRCSSPNAPPR